MNLRRLPDDQVSLQPSSRAGASLPDPHVVSVTPRLGPGQDSPGVPDSAEADDAFGHALVAGDFDGDGYEDLAIGAMGEGFGSAPRAGAVTVLFGSDSGLTASGSQQWHQDSPGVPGGSEPDDNFGEAVAAGDFNRDGCSDLAVGVPGEALGPRLAAGSVRILRGSALELLRGVSSAVKPAAVAESVDRRADHRVRYGPAAGSQRGLNCRHMRVIRRRRFPIWRRRLLVRCDPIPSCGRWAANALFVSALSRQSADRCAAG